MTKAKKKLEFPGAALISALHTRAEELGVDRHQMAAALGITYPYLRALSSGGRPISGLSEEKLRNMADFLGCTFGQVLMKAGILRPEDFVDTREVSIDVQLEGVVALMRKHQDWSNVAPTEEEWASLSRPTRLGVAMLWERELGRELLQKVPLVIVERASEKMSKSPKKQAG
ncbi:helix-turn-helix domain-containing protein [Allochromatium tepidum]|uniref:HTH cro/C1-type domain-containing protein n=1 Tax=Allochromatium tepidum TaxID=553982 RepID=A0ABM7QRN3_9GAMM|nr:helix-turn-helix transcriptional regulator [Allochromatium tepidum]BCU08334.1 hypothetical protein Atep_30110 [Allochromatium tepidum]